MLFRLLSQDPLAFLLLRPTDAPLCKPSALASPPPFVCSDPFEVLVVWAAPEANGLAGSDEVWSDGSGTPLLGFGRAHSQSDHGILCDTSAKLVSTTGTGLNDTAKLLADSQSYPQSGER